MYISQNISIKTSTDHNIYSTKEMDSAFVEILLPNQPTYVFGTIYKHSPIKPHKFKNLFSELLLKLQNQKTVLTGDFNLNLINHAKKPKTHNFLEQIFSKNVFHKSPFSQK